ncbi:MAG TPA: hypothetical protein VNT26_06120, partial [Candidatus Sulfotelmatobacter sp.]|nr:hypothetical protein [Candidatus Sulfotelmatobacter sp.]
WNDAGRNANWATVLYSTVANPSTFIPLVIVTNSPAVTEKSVIRATITPAAGLLASNVYAIKVDFTTPPGIPNGYSGFSQINAFGSPSANPAPGPVVAAENQNTDTPSWALETPSLIAGQLPSSAGLGDNNAGSFTLQGAGGLVKLTDGTIGTSPEFAATCGGPSGGGGTFVTYTAAQGWILTNIVVYTGWTDFGRDGQFYHVSYSSVSAPNTFLPLASVAYNPDIFGGATANRVVIAPPVGKTALATNVAAVKFDFTPQGSQDYGYSGYTEIILQGSNLSVPTPPIVGAPTVSGGNLIFTGTGGTPNRAYSLVTATNLLTPLAEWTVSTTGVLDGSGAFSNAVPVDPATPVRFFRLQMPW